jgi:Flp pilus assembly protein TadG
MSGHDTGWRHGRKLMADDQGGAGELAVGIPLLMLLVLGVIQFALLAHAQHIASLAAAQGVAVARTQNGTAAAGQAQAEQALAQLGNPLLTGTRVNASVDARQARITVTGTVESIVPGLRLRVRAVDAGAREVWTTPATGGSP